MCKLTINIDVRAKRWRVDCVKIKCKFPVDPPHLFNELKKFCCPQKLSNKPHNVK